MSVLVIFSEVSRLFSKEKKEMATVYMPSNLRLFKDADFLLADASVDVRAR